jgi:hypothetical protein
MKKLILIGILLLIGGFCFAQIQNPFKYGYGEEVVIKPTDEMRTEAGAIYNSEEMKNLSEPERVKQTWQKWLQQQNYYPQYRNYIVTDVVVKNGATQEIYISPPALPLISPCDKGIGPCLLFLFDKFLRFLYTASLAIGVLILIWAGISYMVGKPEEVSKTAGAKLKYGVLGVSIAILAFTIVTAIERGFTEELATTPTGGGAGGGGAGGQVTLSTINIYTPRITNEGKFTFMYGTDQDVSCDFIYAIYDLDTAGPPIAAKTLGADQTMNIEGVNIDLTKHGGHKLRVTFQASDPTRCMVSQKFVDLTAPTVTIVAQNPKIFIKEIKIDGTKYISIKLPENITLSDVLQTALQAGAQYYLYNPPFNARIYFHTDQSAQKNGRCYIAAILRGVSVPYVDVYNLKSVTVKEFRKYFEFALDYSKNRDSFVTTIPLSLDNNIVKGVHVEIYGYRGDCTMSVPQDLGFININE